MTSQLGHHRCDVTTMTMMSLVSKRHLSLDVIWTSPLWRHLWLTPWRQVPLWCHHDVPWWCHQGWVRIPMLGQGRVRTSRSGPGRVGLRWFIFDQNYILVKTSFDQNFYPWPQVKPLTLNRGKTFDLWPQSNLWPLTVVKHLWINYVPDQEHLLVAI